MNHRTLSAATTLAAGLLASTAHAAPPATDIQLSLQGPGPIQVDTVGHYEALVENLSNRRANNVQLSIQLPETATSPTVHVLGVLSNVDNRCAQAGTVLTCNLGRLDRHSSTTVGFDLDAPYSTTPIEISASVSTTSSETQLANNDDALLVDHTYVATPFTAPAMSAIDHCTGQGLISFHDCIVSPGSVSSHQSVLEPNGSISFPGQGPNYSGTWVQATPEDLHMEYFDSGNLVMTFDGKGIGNNCFDGAALFAPPWMAMYRVCL